MLAKRAQEEEERKQREKEHTVFVSQIHPKVPFFLLYFSSFLCLSLNSLGRRA